MPAGGGPAAGRAAGPAGARGRGAGGEGWGAVRGSGVPAEPLESLDPTRRVARLTIDGVEVPARLQLSGITRAQVRALGVTLAAADASGGAAWCVDTASSYAAVREQFGRPIGQFQGVKHRCADMLVALEQIRSVAWDAAAALDADMGDDQAALATSIAVYCQTRPAVPERRPTWKQSKPTSSPGHVTSTWRASGGDARSGSGGAA